VVEILHVAAGYRVGALRVVASGGIHVDAAGLQAIVKDVGFGQAVAEGDLAEGAGGPVTDARIHGRQSGRVLRVAQAATYLGEATRGVEILCKGHTEPVGVSE